LLFTAVGLSMDASAVSISNGITYKRTLISKVLLMAFYFGLFQAGMPLLGYLLGSLFYAKVAVFDHWIAFILLGIIGARMIQESFSKEEKPESASLSVPNMLLLAIATSIDALAVGITFAFLNVNIYYAITIIGVTTFSLSVAGVKIGSIFGTKYKSRAEFVGGAVLIVLGVRILFQHLFFK
jgi:putative Mn2+ efflux pump MntP